MDIDSINGMKIELRPMIFVDQMAPNGFLTRDDACHACWYYFILAKNGIKAHAGGIENQVIEVEQGLETPLWMDKHFAKQALSVSFLYGLASPDEMWKFWPNVRMEALRWNFQPPTDEMMNPKITDRIT